MKKLPILCYHKVGPERLEGRRLNIEPETLATHVAYFVRRGHRFVLARDLASFWTAKSVCLTFDDAYETTLTHGVEAMSRHRAVSSIYAVSGLIGQSSAWDLGNERPLADISLLLAAQTAGHEIGNHTASHVNLSELPLDVQIEEIRAADAELRAQGINLGSLALPYGGHNSDTQAAVRSAGYRVGLALGHRRASERDDRLLLPRIVVAYSDRLPKLLYKIHVRPFLPTFRRRSHYV